MCISPHPSSCNTIGSSSIEDLKNMRCKQASELFQSASRVQVKVKRTENLNVCLREKTLSETHKMG